MSNSLIFTEGKDDVNALTEIFKNQFGLTVVTPATPTFSGRTFLDKTQNREIRIVNARDKVKVASAARRELLEYSLRAQPADRLGLVFDPNGDTEPQWRAWILREVLSSIPPTQQDDLSYRITLSGSPIDLVPVPWDAGAITDLLENVQNLERVALEIVRRASPTDEAMTVLLLTSLQNGSRSTTWKTAFRLFNAIRCPDTEDGCMSQVFGQDAGLRVAVGEVLKTTRLFERIAFLAGSSTPSA